MLSVGTNACYHFCKRFKEEFGDDIFIIGADINDPWLVPSISYVNLYYKVPYSNDNSFEKSIEQIIIENSPDYILPSFDFDQVLFYDGSPLLEKYGVKSISTPKETLIYYKDKKSMFDYLQKTQLPLPRAYTKDQLDDHSSYFIKPINGVGSAGATKKTGHEIKQMDTSGYLIQEICTGPEITMECFSHENYFSCICRERIATKAGVCTKARIHFNEELEKIGKTFAKKIHVPMLFNLQFMFNNENKPVITDVNLRSAGGMSISYAAGWDVVKAIGEVLLGRTPNYEECFPSPIQEQYVVRTYTDIVTKKIRPIVAFDLDGTLLDSRNRHIAVMNEILSRKKIAIPLEDLIDFKSNGNNNIDYLISKGLSATESATIQKEWIANIEKEDYLKLDTLYPDAKTILEQEGQHNDLVLITARSNKENLLQQLKELGLSDVFVKIAVVSGDNISQKKAQEIRKCNAIRFYGDTYSDKKAADEAGVKFVYHENGFHSKKYVMGLK